MGANQSSKSQLSAQRRASTDDSNLGCGQQQEVRNKFTASLRKSVSSVLSGKQKSFSKSGSPKGRKNIPPPIAASADKHSTANGSLQSDQADAYYVTAHRANNNNNFYVPPTSSMNNYVTMQQQQQQKPQPRSMTIVSAASQNNSSTIAAAQSSPLAASVAATGTQLDQENRNNTQNGVYGLAGRNGGACKSAGSAATAAAAATYAASGGNFYTTTTMDLVSTSAAAQPPVEVNRDGSFKDGNIAQDTQLHSSSGGSNSMPTSAAAAASRSQRQHHPTSSTPQYQLSRAVNTKTSSVLNNATATSNGNAAVAMPKSHGRGHQQQQQHQQQQSNGIASNNKADSQRQMQTSLATQNATYTGGDTVAAAAIKTPNSKSPQTSQQQPAYQQQQQLIDSANKAAYHRPTINNINTAGAIFYGDDAAVDAAFENQQQYYARNLLDMNKMHGFQQQVRYKCPSQQYQYLNSNQSAIDFHQASYHNNNPLQQNHLYHRGGPQQSYLMDAGLKQQQHQQQPPIDGRGYNRSYSFGSSLTSDANNSHHHHKKSHNPLMSIFQGGPAATATPTNKQLQHSNTISLAKHRNSNKSSANINSINQRSFSSSLKRIKSAPLTAQQASYEAMRTIDMYLIRQIARSCMDFEMEQKIDLEIRLRELAAQSMLEARTEIDVLEVEKSLLTSDQRMNCYASQLEQQRKQLSNPSLSTDSGRGSKSGHRRSDVVDARSNGGGSGSGDASSPSFSSLSNSQSPSKLSPVSGQSANSPSFTSSHHSKSGGYTRRSSSSNTLNRAKNKKREQLMQSITSLSNINCNMTVNNRASISVSEIRIPLMWRDVDHFKGRGDYKRFAIFCLLKIDSQIYDTQLISDVDREVTDVTFDDLVVFNEIEHNFELTLEVYSCVYLEQFSLSSTPRKLKEKLTSSVSRAMGRRLATQTASANYTKELQVYDKSYRFAMIASATLRLEDASDSVKTYDLVLVSPSAHHRNYPMYSNLSNSTTAAKASMTLSNTKDINKNTLPLFGHFCCKLFVRPDVFDKCIKTGYLKVATINVPTNHNSSGSNNTLASSSGSGRDGDSPSSTNGYDSTTESTKYKTAVAASSKMATLSMSSSTVHWGLLRNFALHLWPIDEQNLDYSVLIKGELPQLDNSRKPPLTLNIDKYTRLLRVSNSSLTLESGDCCFVLGTYCQDAGLINQADEIRHWLRAIEQQIYDSHIWGTVLNHYPPHTKQPTPDGGHMLPNHAMRNLRNSRTAATYS